MKAKLVIDPTKNWSRFIVQHEQSGSTFYSPYAEQWVGVEPATERQLGVALSNVLEEMGLVNPMWSSMEKLLEKFSVELMSASVPEGNLLGALAYNHTSKGPRWFVITSTDGQNRHQQGTGST